MENVVNFRQNLVNVSQLHLVNLKQFQSILVSHGQVLLGFKFQGSHSFETPSDTKLLLLK